MKFFILRLIFPTLYKFASEYGARKAFKEIGVYPDDYTPIYNEKMCTLKEEITFKYNCPTWIKTYFVEKIYKRTKQEFDENIRMVRPLRLFIEKAYEERMKLKSENL